MTDVDEDRPNGLHNLWGFGWTSGGMLAALLVGAFFVWFYGSVAVGWWKLVQEFRALPEGLKGVLAAMVFAILYMGWVIIQMDKQHRALRERMARFETDAFHQKNTAGPDLSRTVRSCPFDGYDDCSGSRTAINRPVPTRN